MLAALRQFGTLFAMPHTLGILVLGAVTYAAFISLRGLWLGPLLIERHGYSLVQSGNVALDRLGRLAVRPAAVRPAGPRRARRAGAASWRAAWPMRACSPPSPSSPRPGSTSAAPSLIGLLSGFIVWQYADVRVAYPAALTGRAMAVFTMAMFLGVALMQWLTGVAASVAAAMGIEPFKAVLATIAALLVAGAAAFAWLPKPGADFRS